MSVTSHLWYAKRWISLIQGCNNPISEISNSTTKSYFKFWVNGIERRTIKCLALLAMARVNFKERQKWESRKREQLHCEICWWMISGLEYVYVYSILFLKTSLEWWDYNSISRVLRLNKQAAFISCPSSKGLLDTSENKHKISKRWHSITLQIIKSLNAI